MADRLSKGLHAGKKKVALSKDHYAELGPDEDDWWQVKQIINPVPLLLIFRPNRFALMTRTSVVEFVSLILPRSPR